MYIYYKSSFQRISHTNSCAFSGRPRAALLGRSETSAGTPPTREGDLNL